MAELLDQACKAGASTGEILQSIVEEMPHLTSADIQQVASTHAEESKLDAAVYLAEAEASRFIAEMIKEAGRISGQPSHNITDALQILVARAEQGDKRAGELLEKFDKVAPNVGLSEPS